MIKSPQRCMSLAAGTRLGPYQILSSIGKGGMGEVYKARDTRLARIVAVKVSKAKYTQRAEREARAVASLNHPHVCQLYDVGPNYLVMEYLEGTRLRGPLAPEKAVEYAIEILDALDAAHRKGVIHRDLKPSNIMITGAGVKLLDFGVAKVYEPVIGADEATLTDQGEIVGSPHYISPEQLRGTEADVRSDLFAFGLVFYEMLTGKRAYEGTNATLIADIIHKDPAGLSTERAITAPYEKIIRTCIAKDPGERWQSARELKHALEWVAADVTATPLRLAPVLRWVLAAVAAAFVTGGIGYWLGQRGNTLLPEVRYLTYSGRDYAPSASPDGRSVAFASTRDGTSRIWLKELARGVEAALTAGADTLPRFSPDGSMILFTRFEGTRSALYRIPVLGGEPRRVVDDAISGDWSPDGKAVVFLRPSRRAEGIGTMVGKIGADGGGEQVIFDSKNTGLIQDNPTWSRNVQVHPRWSPNGKTIAITQGGLDAATPSSIFLLDVDGKNPRTVPAAHGGFYLSSLAWLALPDEVIYTQTETIGPVAGGTRGIRQNLRTGETRQVFSSADVASVVDVLGTGRAVFDSARPSQNVREVDVRGRRGAARAIDERWITRGHTHDRQPVYSPGGDYVLFSSNRSGNLDLWEVSTKTGTLRRITDDPANDWDPAYAPDGTSIAWSSNRSGHQEIWVALADGGSPHQVSHDGEDAENPVFLRDGQSILYVSWNPAKRGVWKIGLDGSGARMLIPGHNYAEVSPNGQYAVSLSPAGDIRAFRISDGSAVGFEIKKGGRMRWMPDGRAVAFVAMNEKGVTGVFVQDFAPGQNTAKTRRPLGGFDPERVTETFGISPDGTRLAISSTDQLSNLIVVARIAGIAPPRRAR
jgi:Tol biopolymer transport system component/predicted Ser/Thr protein kinase